MIKVINSTAAMIKKELEIHCFEFEQLNACYSNFIFVFNILKIMSFMNMNILAKMPMYVLAKS